jgi:hypothetical protein
MVAKKKRPSIHSPLFIRSIFLLWKAPLRETRKVLVFPGQNTNWLKGLPLVSTGVGTQNELRCWGFTGGAHPHDYSFFCFPIQTFLTQISAVKKLGPP